MRHILTVLPVVLLLSIPCAVLQAQQPPGVGYVFPAGGKAGTTVAVRLGGYDWTPDVQFFVHDSRVRLEIDSFPGVVLLPDPPFWFGIRSFANDPPLPREVAARFVVPADVPAGPIRWRVANANGGSACGVFMVGHGHEVVEAENRKGPQELAALPITVSGRLGRIEEVDSYRFKAERNGPVTCTLAARQLGSDLHGVLEVRDSTGHKLADAVDTEGRDTALTFFAEKGQSYTVVVRDLDHRGYRSMTYRLALTPGPRVLAALPAAGRRGETRAVEFVGIGVATGQAKIERVTRQVNFPATAGRTHFAYRLETASGSAPEFPLLLSDLPEQVEPATPDAGARRLAIPTAVSGCLVERDRTARFTFVGAKGEIWRFVAEARRLGSTLDLTLTVVGPDGKELATSEDLPGSAGPVANLTLPMDGVYQVIVADMSGTRELRSAVYRLVVDRPTSDFRLLTLPVVNLPIDGKVPLTVNVVREGGFKEAIALTIKGLPPGVTVPANLIVPPTANSLAIPLQCAKGAPAAAALVEITGSAEIGGKTVTRTARAPAAGNLAPREPELNQVPTVLIATTIKPPFKVKALQADGGLRVHRGATHLAEVALERKEGFAGEIVLDMAAAQQRHRQGIRGPALPVPPGVAKVAYPVFVPEWLETARTSRIGLVAMAKVLDPKGTPRYVLAPMEGQITMSIEGALLKLAHAADELLVEPGQAFLVPLKVARSAKLKAPVHLNLLVPQELAGLIQAEALTLTPMQTSASWRIKTKIDPRFTGVWILTARATAFRDNHPVVSETGIEVEFVKHRQRAK